MTIDLVAVYNEIVDRLEANGEKDANAQAADAIELIVELEDEDD